MTILISLVLSLIVQAQQPNLPTPLRVEALELAQEVLTYASTQNATTTEATTSTEIAPAQNVEATTSAPTLPEQLQTFTTQVVEQATTTDTQTPAPAPVEAATVPLKPTSCKLSASGNEGTTTLTWQMMAGATGTIEQDLQNSEGQFVSSSSIALPSSSGSIVFQQPAPNAFYQLFEYTDTPGYVTENSNCGTNNANYSA